MGRGHSATHSNHGGALGRPLVGPDQAWEWVMLGAADSPAWGPLDTLPNPEGLQVTRNTSLCPARAPFHPLAPFSRMTAPLLSLCSPDPPNPYSGGAPLRSSGRLPAPRSHCGTHCGSLNQRTFHTALGLFIMCVSSPAVLCRQGL